jgi:hypothetical protein
MVLEGSEQIFLHDCPNPRVLQIINRATLAFHAPRSIEALQKHLAGSLAPSCRVPAAGEP